MNDIMYNKSVITPEKAQQILLDDGLKVTLDEAKLILDFLKILAKIVVKKHLETNENSGFIHKGKH